MDETQALLATDSFPDRHGEPGNPQRGSGRRKRVVDFDPDGDADNPMEWPAAFKWGIVLLLALMAFTVYVLLSLPTYYIGT